jgi:hypothetical protein
MLPESEAKARFASRLRAWRNGAQINIPPNAWVVVQLNTVAFDGLNEFEPAPNYRFRPRRAGYYLIIGSVRVTLGNGEVSQVALVLNSLTIMSQAFTLEGAVASNPTPTATLWYLTPNDYVDLRGAWTNGVGLRAFTGSQESTYLCVHRLS